MLALPFIRFLLPYALGGLLLGLSMPGFGLWPLAWIALIPAMRGAMRRASAEPSLFRVFSAGCLIGFLWHGLCFLWFFDLHPLTWLGFSEWGSRWITFAGWLLLAVEGALLTGLLMGIYRLLPSGGWRILLFPFLWILGFAVLNGTPMALPWSLLEYSQVDVALMRRLAGLLTASAPAVAVVFHNAFWAEWQAKPFATQSLGYFTKRFGPFVVPVCLMALQWDIPGGWMERLPESQAGWPVPVAIVQGNLPIEQIRSGNMPQSLVDTAYIQPAQRLRLPEGALLIYPEEGVVTGWTPEENPEENPTVRRLIRMARERRISILVGVSATTDAWRHRYNASLLISPQGGCRFYHKRRLVPFGEFTPYSMEEPLHRLLAGAGVDYSTMYEPGSKEQAAVSSIAVGKTRIGPLICFELIDSAPVVGGFAMRYRRQGVGLLVNINNLGWFHDNPLLEAQFLSIGRMRAVETGLPLVIAGNTGVSALISPEGEVLRQTSRRSDPGRRTQIMTYFRSDR